jgi:hypothetical protein
MRASYRRVGLWLIAHHSGHDEECGADEVVRWIWLSLDSRQVDVRWSVRPVGWSGVREPGSVGWAGPFFFRPKEKTHPRQSISPRITSVEGTSHMAKSSISQDSVWLLNLGPVLFAPLLSRFNQSARRAAVQPCQTHAAVPTIRGCIFDSTVTESGLTTYLPFLWRDSSHDTCGIALPPLITNALPCFTPIRNCLMSVLAYVLTYSAFANRSYPAAPALKLCSSLR